MSCSYIMIRLPSAPKSTLNFCQTYSLFLSSHADIYKETITSHYLGYRMINSFVLLPILWYGSIIHERLSWGLTLHTHICLWSLDLCVQAVSANVKIMWGYCFLAIVIKYKTDDNFKQLNIKNMIALINWMNSCTSQCNM